MAINLRFDNRYARLHPAFYQVVDPTPLPDPYLVAFNPDAARRIGLDPDAVDRDELTLYLAGNRRIPGSEPVAQAYAGHQFGVWVPQLGDGRAFLLGQVINPEGESWDLHLKGAGQTRFSRFGDGRSVLRSAIREYLASEALAGLGIPTTRALAIAGSDLPVQRERVETAATLLRLAPSHVRFGTFEYFAARGETDRVGELLDHVVARHYPEVAAMEERGEAGLARMEQAVAFFGQVCRRTARLMARWVAAGFAHGVMNTDNMSILGITLDYGPYGFLDDYDAGFICNHTDEDGRYAFGRQPAVGMWNCARLGEALMVLDREAMSRPDDPARTAPWQDALESYWPAFNLEYGSRMRAKLGLTTERADDADLIRELLAVLQESRADYSIFFRELGHFQSGPGGFVRPPRGLLGEPTPRLGAWLARYAERLRRDGSEDPARREEMTSVNPEYVLRNWIAQEAIERAEQKDFGLIESLRLLFREPFREHPGMERFSEPPRGAAREIVVSCSS